MSGTVAVPHNGLNRAARLMRALGARANPVWAALSPREAERLSAQMERLGDDSDGENAAASALVDGLSRSPARAPVSVPSSSWAAIARIDPARLADRLSGESPQILAVILSCLPGEAAAKLVRALPRDVATPALQRLLHLGEVRTGVSDLLAAQLAPLSAGETANGEGPARVAGIFDTLGERENSEFLSALDAVEPGTSERVRALMFTFDDLATLDAAGMQTLLASAGRDSLVLALKGARETTAAAFFANMTSRAGEMLRGEIEAAGPVRRSEIEAARGELVALARDLARRGDILSGAREDDELVE